MINEKDYNSKSMLYRFRSDSEYNFNALLNNEMFAATPNFLNDPLDCPITYDLDKLYKKLLKRKAFINKYAKEIFPSSKDKIRPSNFENFELYEAYRDSIFEEERSKLLDVNNSSIVKDFIKFLANDIIFKVRECFGIVSFSLTYDNGLMWSHYASNYKGFVLGYNLLNFNKTLEMFIKKNHFLNKYKDICGLYKVNYVSTEDIIDGTDLMYELLSKRMADKYEFTDIVDFLLLSKYKQILLTLLTTKDKSWEYEQEIRLIFPREDMWASLRNLTHERAAQFFKVSKCYHPNIIIMGSNMSSVKRAVVGFYCYKNDNVILSMINTDRLMSERVLYLTLVNPKDLVV